ncbi:MAG: dihydrofolate reductase family protein [Verrucomicrobia bacterium]|nr:dihydrofolate reductase family protein [Verrucomicrobiota bacterium]
MTEAGGVFSAALFAAGLVDEVVIYLAPRLCGGTLPALAGPPWRESLSLVETDLIQLGDDLRFRGIILQR